MPQILMAADGAISMALGGALLDDPELNLDAVTDGRTALDRLSEAPNFYDLIVLDYTLPELSGVACMRFVRKLLPRLPAMILSDDTGPDRLNELAGVGVRAHQVIPRSVSPEAFADHVKKALSTASQKMRDEG